MEDISGRVRSRREELGLTQSQIARACDITQQAYMKLENGETKRPRFLLELAEILQTSPGWILNGSNRDASIDAGLPSAGFISPLKIPIYSYYSCINDNAKIKWDSDSVIDWISPLPGQENATKSVALLIQGHALEPFYKQGSLLFMNLHKFPAQRGICVFDTATSSKIAIYHSHDAKNHIFTDLHSQKDYTLPKIKIKGLYKIIGAIYG
jgi:transcriptional regulator with XRE-family HTH domain